METRFLSIRRALKSLFQPASKFVDCVILNACFSEIQAKVIAQRIPHVIGIKQNILYKADIAFSVGFYAAVASNWQIPKAYQLGLVQMAIEDCEKNDRTTLYTKSKILNHRPTQPVKWMLGLAGIIDKTQRFTIETLVHHLRNTIDDTSLTLKSFEEGGILVLEGVLDGFEYLHFLFYENTYETINHCHVEFIRLKLDSFSEIAAAYTAVEMRRSQGDLRGVYRSFRIILSHRIESFRHPNAHASSWMAADLTIIQSLADLALYFGDRQAADDLLIGLRQVCQEAGNVHRADYATLKRVQLALDSGELRWAQELVDSLAPQIGFVDNIDFSLTGLVTWERECYWPETDERDRQVLFTHLLLVMGQLLSALGQYGAAIVVLERGLFHAQEEHEEESNGPDLAHQMLLPLQLCIAQAHLEKGELDNAQTWLGEIGRKLDPNGQKLYYIRWLHTSSKRHLLMGGYGQALEELQQLRLLCQQIGSYHGLLWANLDLAGVLIFLNQISQAKQYIAQVQSVLQYSDNSDLLNRAHLWSLLADARRRPIDPMPISLIRQSQETALMEQDNTKPKWLFSDKQSANYLKFFEDRALDFQWLLNQANYAKAALVLDHIKDVFHVSDSKLIQTRIKVLEGMLAYYLAAESQASYLDKSQEQSVNTFHWSALCLNTACSDLIEMGLQPEVWQGQRLLGWYLEKLQSPIEQQQALSEKTNNLLMKLTSSLKPEDQVLYLLNKWTAEEEFIATEINKLEILRANINQNNFLLKFWKILQLGLQLHLLLEHIDDYKSTLSQENLKIESLHITKQSIFSFFKRFWTHPFRRANLIFLVLPTQVFIVSVWKFGLHFSKIETTRDNIRDIVKKWHKKAIILNRSRSINPGHNISNNSRDIGQFDDVNEQHNVEKLNQELEECANELTQTLELPTLIQKLPKWINRLTIVPDDSLHGFPFSVLKTRNSYWIEDYAISIAYESWQKRSKISTAFFQSRHSIESLLVSVSKGAKSVKPIPLARQEVRQVGQWLQPLHIEILPHEVYPSEKYIIEENFASRKHIIMDNSASREYLIHQLPNVNFFHISCHGLFQLNQPEKSGLVLILPNDQIEILSLKDLSQLTLTNLRHVTLASCWAADHYILPGRWIISLPETLWRAGAESILGCLWEVYDHVSVTFMDNFYHNLRTMPRDQALRKTQLDCLNNKLDNGPNLNLSNPIYWSGFNLYGSPYRVKI